VTKAVHVDEALVIGQSIEQHRPVLLVPALEGYQRWAPTYDHVPNPLLALEERYLLPQLTGLSNKSVLDLGCGTGRWLLKLGQSVSGVGIDCSISMLQVAGRKSAIRGRLVQAACESLPLINAAFELAVCSFALGHIRTLDPVVRELRRVMKLDGDVFVSDLHPEAYERGWRVGFRDGATAVQIETQPRSAEQIIDAFSSNGFDCQAQHSLRLGEPEEPLFARAGKSGSFSAACRLPAVLLCHFRRTAEPWDERPNESCN
jgi:ubiquinone/menaquinone biosynthesis C-methylase UbiE